MITTDLTTLKINKLTQAQYDAAAAAGLINENELYITPPVSLDHLFPKSGGSLESDAILSWQASGTSTGDIAKIYTISDPDSQQAELNLESASGAVNMHAARLINVSAPTANTDAANKVYVDQAMENNRILSSPSTTASTVYITGVTTENGNMLYNTAVNFVPSTGTLNASVINAAKIYGAVWNDYAEWFEKEDENEVFEPGDICAWNESGVVKANSCNAVKTVGAYSDTYGQILGGERLADMHQNIKRYVPIGLVGRVNVKVQGPVEIGDLIVPSDLPGVGIVAFPADQRKVIGKALARKESTGIERIPVLMK